MKTVVYAATRNIYDRLIPCINSVRKNGNIDEVIVLAEDDAIAKPITCRVINVSKQTFFGFGNPNAAKRWTWMALMKCALSKVLDLDKVLFLDCDTIVEHDISELWDLDMDGYYYAGVKQPGHSTVDFTYINTGVLMCNLKKLRDGKEDELIKMLNTKEYGFPDQDVINERCQGHILPIAGRFNRCAWTEPDVETYITHYAVTGIPAEIRERYNG